MGAGLLGALLADWYFEMYLIKHPVQYSGNCLNLCNKLVAGIDALCVLPEDFLPGNISVMLRTFLVANYNVCCGPWWCCYMCKKGQKYLEPSSQTGYNFLVKVALSGNQGSVGGLFWVRIEFADAT